MPIDIFTSTSGQLNGYEQLRLRIEGIKERAEKAVPWGPDTVGIPAQPTVNALLRINDVAFYANARNETTVFADLCLSLLALHHPRDGGGISSNGTLGVQRCSCCMLRWPCPTIREMSVLLT